MYYSWTLFSSCDLKSATVFALSYEIVQVCEMSLEVVYNVVTTRKHCGLHWACFQSCLSQNQLILTVYNCL